MLREWTGSGRLQAAVTAKLAEWFDAGLARLGHLARRAVLRLRDSRRARQVLLRLARRADRLPGELPAIYCDRTRPRLRRATGSPDSDAEVYHFIGKDIVYFHTLFWPAVLHGAGFRTPTAVLRARLPDRQRPEDVEVARHVHHRARAGSTTCRAEYLRYYFASRLGPGIDDIDLNLDEFATKVNADLVGKLVNIASRCAGFIARGYGGPARRRTAGPGAATASSSAPASASRRPTTAATRGRHARDHGARPTARTSTSTSTSPGCWRRTRRAPPRCRRSARRASTCSACWRAT